MAKLQVGPEYLVDILFNGAASGVRIVGASFDADRHMLEFDIEGVDVPDADRVNGILRKRFSVLFEPV